jgi:hypothetical protein
MPRCKNCSEKFEPIRFNMKYCLKDECVRVWVESEKEKVWKKKKAKAKQDLMTLSDYLKLAQQVFNKYIRLRDKGQLCISCQKTPKKQNAGHYFSSGGHSNVRFDEDNVHLQCEHCNTFLSGNLLNYQIEIEKRIGAEKLIELQTKAHIVKKWSIEELKEIINEYKQKVKQIENESK